MMLVGLFIEDKGELKFLGNFIHSAFSVVSKVRGWENWVQYNSNNRNGIYEILPENIVKNLWYNAGKQWA